MLYCRKCKTDITGDKRCCPLCQGELSGSPQKNSDVFPNMQTKKYSRSFTMKLVAFIAIVLIVVCFSVNILVSTQHWWSLFAGAAIVWLWITVVAGITQRRNISKAISLELFLLTAFAVLADVSTGWHRWSIDYVIPVACIMSMISMVIASKLFHKSVNDYVVYLVISAIYGIIPVIFIFTGVLNQKLPSVLCVASSIILIAAILIFEGRNMKYEFTKRFHI
ncbi:MAG: DUF6320 domain-containing protein [Oscillospiraceae bacterium]|nr:DUF6320 domain-containing protein [Oscillospiraceae bacterium]